MLVTTALAWQLHVSLHSAEEGPGTQRSFDAAVFGVKMKASTTQGLTQKRTQSTGVALKVTSEVQCPTLLCRL